MKCPECRSSKVYIVRKVRHKFRVWFCHKCQHSWRTEDK